MKAGWYIALRVLLLVPVIAGVTLTTFLIARVVPGDPARMIVGEFATQDAVNQARHEFGLDQPLPVQYVTYIWHLAQGDLGSSYITRRPVLESLLQAAPATLELALAAMAIGIILGGTMGVLAAVRRGSAVDHVARLTAVAGASVPSFWIGLTALVVFYLWLGVLPGDGRLEALRDAPRRVTGMYLVDSALAGDWATFASSARHLVLPAFTLGIAQTAAIARVLRASLLEALGQDYVRTARAKGVPERRVIVRHALRNALLPTVTVLGLQVGGLLEGAVLTETVFGWPGMGRFAVESIRYLDYPAVLGFTVVAATVFVVINLAVDVLYTILDPRVNLVA
jgi:peptide/nickel transport system permease protein